MSSRTSPNDLAGSAAVSSGGALDQQVGTGIAKRSLGPGSSRPINPGPRRRPRAADGRRHPHRDAGASVRGSWRARAPLRLGRSDKLTRRRECSPASLCQTSEGRPRAKRSSGLKPTGSTTQWSSWRTAIRAAGPGSRTTRPSFGASSNGSRQHSSWEAIGCATESGGSRHGPERLGKTDAHLRFNPSRLAQPCPQLLSRPCALRQRTRSEAPATSAAGDHGAWAQVVRGTSYLSLLERSGRGPVLPPSSARRAGRARHRGMEVERVHNSNCSRWSSLRESSASLRLGGRAVPSPSGKLPFPVSSLGRHCPRRCAACS